MAEVWKTHWQQLKWPDLLHPSTSDIGFVLRKGGDISAGENFRGEIVFKIGAETPPGKFLRDPGHFLVLGPVANIFLLYGGTGAHVLHVRISRYANVYPETNLLCVLCIPKDFLVHPLCTPRTVVPTSTQGTKNLEVANFPHRKIQSRNPCPVSVLGNLSAQPSPKFPSTSTGLLKVDNPPLYTPPRVDGWVDGSEDNEKLVYKNAPLVFAFLFKISFFPQGYSFLVSSGGGVVCGWVGSPPHQANPEPRGNGFLMAKGHP